MENMMAIVGGALAVLARDALVAVGRVALDWFVARLRARLGIPPPGKSGWSVPGPWRTSGPPVSG